MEPWSSPAGASYLGLPLHSRHGDAQEEDDRDGADDPDIVGGVRHQGARNLLETQ